MVFLFKCSVPAKSQRGCGTLEVVREAINPGETGCLVHVLRIQMGWNVLGKSPHSPCVLQ